MGKKRNPKLASKATNNTKKKAESLAEKTEQILLTMPRIIAAQISKDLDLLKQQEGKLKLQLSKAMVQKKKLLAQFSKLKKTKTAAAKKKLIAGQKLLKKTTDLASMLAYGLEALLKQTSALAHKKAKYSALQSQLGKFAKEWSKKAKQAGSAKAKAKTKTKTKIKAKSKKTVRKKTKKNNNDYSASAQVIEVIEMPVRREFDSSNEEPTEQMT